MKPFIQPIGYNQRTALELGKASADTQKQAADYIDQLERQVRSLKEALSQGEENQARMHRQIVKLEQR